MQNVDELEISSLSIANNNAAPIHIESSIVDERYKIQDYLYLDDLLEPITETLDVQVDAVEQGVTRCLCLTLASSDQESSVPSTGM